jgi:hypothetical protein
MNEPLSELRLRDLGREAQDLVDLPDLGSLERRGRALRFRRQAGVVAATVVLATTGVFLFQDRTSQEPQPAPPRSAPQVYPGMLMEDLEPGTYELTPSSDGADPTALITVPSGWNSWVGPNRFNGHRDGESNDQALARSTWLVGVAVLKVQGVASLPCQPTVTGSGRDMGYEETVGAVRRVPGYQTAIVRTNGSDLLGYPSTAIHLTPGAAPRKCARASELFESDTSGGVGF